MTARLADLGVPKLDRLSVGVGMISLYGFGLRFPDNSPLATSVITAALPLLDLKPTIAYRVTDILSIGLGADIFTFASFVGQGCANYWAMARNSHLGAMVIVRRQGFSNDQWLIEGTNLLELRYKKPGPFATDPSEIVRPSTCRRHWSVVDNQLRGDWNIQDALSRFPRDAFDFLWLIDVPPYDPKLVEGMELVWSGPGSSLYRVNQRGAERPPTTPQREAAPAR